MATRSPRLTVDDRTESLSNEALICRSLGHKWALRALSRNRFNELIKLGLTEHFRYCENNCGSTWVVVWDISTGEVVQTGREYPKGEYLLPQGTGRLHRKAARIAAFARQHPQYA